MFCSRPSVGAPSPPAPLQDAMAELLATDPADSSHSATLAALDRNRHGLPTGKGGKGSRRRRLLLA